MIFFCNRGRDSPVISHKMRPKFVAIALAGALALGTAVYAEGEHGPHGHRGMGGPGGWGNPLEHLTKELDLTAEQQAKVAPIVDQAKPQIEAIHREAMEKTRAIMENSAAQIRPLLNAEQQAKFDALKKAHEDMMSAMKEMHQARHQ